MKGQFEKDKDDAWYLIISYKDVYEKLTDIFESIKNKISEKSWDTVECDKDYMKIKFESDNILPTDKDVNIRMATIIIRAIFAQDGKYYPSYGPYLCDDCNNMVEKSNDFKNIAIVHI